VALNWLRLRGAIPIFGARTAEQVTENMACFESGLTEEQLRRLEDVSRVRLGFPHDFLNSKIVKRLTYGGMYELIDDHRRPVASPPGSPPGASQSETRT
jgi:hypothetical protein